MSTSRPHPSPILRALEQAPGRSAKAAAGMASRPADTFCAEGSLPLDAMTVSVKGMGPLPSRLSATEAQALQAASQPARHGKRDKTLLDKRVRDTGEVPSASLTVRWADGVCAALQAEVASALGLHAVDLRLHNLLVYGPGQFFKPHQDTEKHDGMVATLVLVWPSPHIGGGLVVRHGREQAQFASQHLNADAIRWFAFYADCRHEVLPVTEGWRVVLSFDLVLPAQTAKPAAAVPPALLDAMRAQFFPATGPTLQPWVFLLEHEYTERGLHWPLLKGADRSRVAALRAAAEALGLTVHLALAEVQEQWTAFEGGSHRGGRDPDELIERRIVLDHWVDANDRVLKRERLPVSETDTASFSETDEAFLIEEEYEGYMGNYGETVDYWFRRAALVVQTPMAEQAGRFISDFDGALADAQGLARQGRGDELAARLQVAGKVLHAQCQHRGRSLFAAYSKLAAALPDAAQARGLMDGFDWVDFQDADARALAKLSARRGDAWTADLINAWAHPANAWRGPSWRVAEFNGAGHGGARSPWPQSPASFLKAGLAAGLSQGLIYQMLQQCLQALVAADTSLAKLSPARRAACLAERLQALCELAMALGHASNADEAGDLLVRHVLAHPLLYPPIRLRTLVQAVHASAPTAAKGLREAVVAALRQALATPERSVDDNALDNVEWVCRCADCREVIRWAESAQVQALTLAMAEARRAHVQQSLSDAGAPLLCTTLRKGSPHKLVVSKPDGLHDSRREQRRMLQADLTALT